MLELKIKAGRRSIPIFDLPTALGRKGAYREIGDQIDALIALMDDWQGDVDLEEDDDPGGNIVDEKHDALSWPEWHTLPPQHRGSGNYTGKLLDHVDRGIAHEDDEEDDAAEEDDPSGQCDEDGINTSSDSIRYAIDASGPGCPISDSGGGNVEDEEQMWFVPANAPASLYAANDR